jgi:hypothetical protein
VPDQQARKINNLQAVVTVLVMLLAGVLLLVWATSLTEWRQTVVEQAGGTLLVAALLTVAWEFYGRRALAGEVMEAARLSTEVQQSGITSVGSNFRSAPWDRLLTAEKIDIYLGLGRTFHSNYSTALKAAAARPNSRIRVVTADPNDEAAVECMAERFTRTAEEVKSDIRLGTEAFLALGRAAKGVVEVYHRTGEPLTALYRFDKEAVITLYSHRRGHGDVPFILCKEGGSLYEFVRDEFDKLIAQGVRQTGQPPQALSARVPQDQN